MFWKYYLNHNFNFISGRSLAQCCSNRLEFSIFANFLIKCIGDLLVTFVISLPAWWCANVIDIPSLTMFDVVCSMLVYYLYLVTSFEFSQEASSKFSCKKRLGTIYWCCNQDNLTEEGRRCVSAVGKLC